eukprot:Selendium_serpulae@DN142_c0_g1_i1.p1
MIDFPSAFSLSSVKDEQPTGVGAAEREGNSVTSKDVVMMQASKIKFDKAVFREMRIIGQFNLGFIITALRLPVRVPAQRGARRWALFIVDQHATDEKHRFEKLNLSLAQSMKIQPLVIPQRLALDPVQEQVVENHLSVLKANGFDLKDLRETDGGAGDGAADDGRRWALQSVPMTNSVVLDESDLRELIDVLIDDPLVCLSETPFDTQSDSSFGVSRAPQTAAERSVVKTDVDEDSAVLWRQCGSFPRPPRLWRILASRACRSAIMIGTPLQRAAMSGLVSRMAALQQPWNCPHGRPTMRHLANTDRASRVDCDAHNDSTQSGAERRVASAGARDLLVALRVAERTSS